MLAAAADAQAGEHKVLIRDVTIVEGIRNNSLIGYGLVVGLRGTWDKQQTYFTIQTLASILQRMDDLADMGVSFSLDDFGTGYSSLSYLNRFPIRIIKIDKSFIAGVPDDARQAAIVNAVIAMGHELGIKVVAEGVEAARQGEFLREAGCDVEDELNLARMSGFVRKRDRRKEQLGCVDVREFVREGRHEVRKRLIEEQRVT